MSADVKSNLKADPPRDSDFKIALGEKSAIDRFLDWSSEFFSSILVKETRQALKSRQFLWTFFGLLLVVILWVFGGLSYTQSNANDDVLPGPYLLFGFWLILGFPLAIVIPFATYRSLAREFEDGSLQLVTITTLKPYQIIWGKLGSSMLQIMLYVSVLAPCIAFTYLLRGIDIRQIWWGVVIASTSSVCLCVLGLFLSSTVKSRNFSVAVSVLFLFGLAFIYWLWGMFSYVLTYESSNVLLSLEDAQAEVMLGGYLSFLLSTAFILFTAAAAHVSFEADNRSSWIRIAILIQQIVFFGWVAALMSVTFDDQMGAFFSSVICHYWFFMGAMMSSVPAIMSRRVKRTLPNTILTRSAFSLFMPGPGRGYLFAIANMLGWNLLLFVLMIFADSILPSQDMTGAGRSLSPTEIEGIALAMLTNFIYGIAFLSILFLFLHSMVKKRPDAGPILGGALAFIFLAVVSMAPVFVQLQWFPNSFRNYMLLSASNWYITLDQIVRYEMGTTDGNVYFALLIMAAVLVASGYLALRIACRELHFLPEAIPNRVLEEDKLKRAAKAPVGETIDDILGIDDSDESGA